MTETLTDFWQRFPTGIEVAVASRLPDKLFGVRDGFNRYFRGRSGGVAVSVSARGDDGGLPLILEDRAILDLARRQARDIADGDGADATFAVGVEAGFTTVESTATEKSAPENAGARRFFLRTWSVVIGLDDESWGSSGSVQIPSRLIGGLADEDVPFAMPIGSTRRHGGMVSALTAGLENRRSATALATFNALASLFYGVFDRPPGR